MACSACNLGVCSYTADGAATQDTTTGDCQQPVCDGAGSTRLVTDDTDLPFDGSQIDCLVPACTGGVPGSAPLSSGASCSLPGGAVCDGAGQCVGCVVAADCAGSDTECATRTCVSNTCGMNYASLNTPVSSQVPGNCQVNVCDGAGLQSAASDDQDLPADQNFCTEDVCTAGVPSNPAKSQGTPLPSSDQAAGDCQVLACDGAGASASYDDNSDVPADTDPTDCGEPACVNGGVSSTNKATGASCGEGNVDVCNATGQCVTSSCGDLLIKSGSEQCDDGNVTNGDGCSSSCLIEAGWSCPPNQSCATVCGDGVVAGTEACDDINVSNGDGCSSACQVEAGWSCSYQLNPVAKSVCTIPCGDGVLAGSEQCDDGNTQDGDGCTSTCSVESTYVCNGQPSVCSCQSGFANCDGSPSNGCETDINTDLNNCGACGSPCGAGQSCAGGVCL